MKRPSIAFMVLCCVAMPATAQFVESVSKVGTVGATFLEIGVGARAVSMGSAFVAVVDDATSMYWNPAGLSRLPSNEAAFMHANWFVDASFDYAAISLRLGDFGVLGLAFTSLSVDEEPVRTVLQPEGTGELFEGGSTAIGIAYAFAITDAFSIGFGAKFISETIWHTSASGFALDVGTLFKTSLNGMKIGMSISNFGTKMQMSGSDQAVLIDPDPTKAGNNSQIPGKYDTQGWDLPLIFRVGVAMDVINSAEHRLTLALDAAHPNNNTEYVNAGAEYGFNDVVFLRGGYANAFVNDGETDLTLGAGVKYSVGAVAFKFDYAYSRFGRLGDISRIQVGMTF